VVPTLDEFIEEALSADARIVRSHVREPGFELLYVRLTERSLEEKLIFPVLDVADIEAEDPGGGAFSRLVERLFARGLSLYVESVGNPRFAQKLLRMGFKHRPGSPKGPGASYYKLQGTAT